MIVGIGVPLLILVVFGGILWAVFRKGPSTAADSDGDADAALPAIDPATAVAAVAAADPSFSYDDFIARVNRVFFIVENAWMNLNADDGRAFLTDGVYQQWKMQLDVYTQMHKRNVLEDLAVLNIVAFTSSHTDELSTIGVRIRACCGDYDIDTTTGKVIRGDKTVRTWQENWTFVRDGKVTSKVAAGVVNCPNCGAPFDGDLEGRCHYCKAPVIGGMSDWVLQRIDQVPDR